MTDTQEQNTIMFNANILHATKLVALEVKMGREPCEGLRRVSSSGQFVDFQGALTAAAGRGKCIFSINISQLKTQNVLGG